MNRLVSYSDRSQNNPMEGFQPMKDAAYGAVNLNYRNVGKRLSSQFASRGYGSSGSFGNSMYDTELARGGDLSGLEGMFAGKAIDQQNFGATLGSQLLNFGKGSTSTGSGTSTTPDTSASNGLMSAGNGMENIATMLMMNKILGGGKP